MRVRQTGLASVQVKCIALQGALKRTVEGGQNKKELFPFSRSSRQETVGIYDLVESKNRVLLFSRKKNNEIISEPPEQNFTNIFPYSN